MGQVMLRLPDELQSHWEQLAKASGRTLEEFIVQELAKWYPPSVSQLPTPLKPEGGNPREFVKSILKEAGLLEEFTEEEKQKYQPLPDEEFHHIAERASKGKPLSEIILEDRGER
ncbi:MAG: hypothetical protein ACK4I8_08825 [Armatimonadota bacterium]